MCSYGCLDDLRNGVEVRDARRSAMAALIAAIVTVVAMLGWITWVAFVVGAIGGIFGIVANSLMLCCGDLNQRPGICCDAGGQLAAHKLPCRLAASKALNMVAFVIHSSSVFYCIAALATNYFGGWYDEANDVFNTRRRSLLSTPDPIVIGLFLPAGFLSLVAGVLEARTALKLAKAQTATRGRVGADGGEARTADVPVATPMPAAQATASAELMPTTTATKADSA